MIRLGVVMTRSVGFSEWRRTGLLDREIRLYQNQPAVSTFFFHDENHEVEYQGIRFLRKSDIHNWELDLIKSNQVEGAELGLIAARKMSIPFILRCGFSWARFESQKSISRLNKWRSFRYEKKIAKKADFCVVSNNSDRELFEKRYRIPKNKLRVHPNYVDCENFKPGNIEEVSNRVLNVGRLAPQKNQKMLIEAMAGVPDSELLIVGEGELENELKDLAKARGVTLNISPFVNSEKLAELYRSSRLFVLSSDYEGLPKVVLEAMASGLPVITTPVQGATEVVEEGVNAYVCESDKDLLAQKINQVLESDNLQLRSNARRTVQGQYSLVKVKEMELRLYKELLGIK